MLDPVRLNKKDFLSNFDLTRGQTIQILDLAQKFKSNKYDLNLKNNNVLGMVFDKSSTRTRVSFQVAMSRLGGTSIDLNPSTSQIGRGEPIKDTARVLSRYCDVLAIRTFHHSDIEEYAHWATIPVINALTDVEHPCQAIADFLTIKEYFGTFNNLKLTFVGDSNNVANSLIICGSLLGIEIRIACPKGYEPNPSILNKANALNSGKNLIKVYNDPIEAVSGSNILYTDVWSSMGEEQEKESKDKNFGGFTLDKYLFQEANSDAIILHCLPAYRGKEIADEIMESENSRIFDQAENRLHAQQALLYSILS